MEDVQQLSEVATTATVETPTQATTISVVPGPTVQRMSDRDSRIAQIDTPGGHIVVCLLLVLVAVGMFFLRIPEYKEIIIGSMAVLFAAMRGKGGAQ